MRIVTYPISGGGASPLINRISQQENYSLTASDLEGITKIGAYAFYNDIKLQSIEIPSSVTTLEDACFFSVQSLKSIIIPNTVTTMGASVFYNARNTESVVLPSNITTIPSNTFNGCTNLKNIVIPSTVISISTGAFRNCPSLKSITIPQGVTSIGNYALELGDTQEEDKATITFLSSTPCTVTSNTFKTTTLKNILVPYSADHSILNAYKSATNWSAFADYIIESEA